MTIKDVEQQTGISKQNIRFYEKKGLLSPERKRENGYREYNQEDVYRLKEIFLYRKLGISLDDIKEILEGQVPLDSVMNHYYNLAALHMNDLKQQMVVYQDINEQLKQGEAFDVEKHLSKIADMEKNGISFFDAMSDYVKKAKDNIYKFSAPRSRMWFEPKQPILTSAEFVDELMRYAEDEKKELEFIHVGMEPIIKLDGKMYLAMLEQPHTINLPEKLYLLQPLFNMYGHTYGFKFVYLYSWNEENSHW